MIYRISFTHEAELETKKLEQAGHLGDTLPVDRLAELSDALGIPMGDYVDRWETREKVYGVKPYVLLHLKRGKDIPDSIRETAEGSLVFELIDEFDGPCYQNTV